MRAIGELRIPHADSVSPFVSISIGIVTKMNPGGLPVEQFSKLAEDALYAAERAGRNRHEQVIA